jgi:hypothetical protein
MAREAAHAAQWIDALDLSRTEAAYSIRSQFFSCPATGPNGMAYVTDTSKPELVQLSAPKGSKNGSGLVTVTMDVPVTLTAPPASQVIDGSKLGM